MPAPSTLSKITTRCGEDAVAGLNEALLARADAAKLVKTGKVRADTTVVSANVEYPTDSGLLAHAVTAIGRLVGRIKAAGGATRTVFRDASEAATTKVHAIGAKLKLRTAQAKEEAQATVLRLTGELADLAQQAVADAAAVLANARRARLRRPDRQPGRRRTARPSHQTHPQAARPGAAQTTADRGYGEAAVDRELEDLGVETVVIPRKGKPGKARQAVEHSPDFRELVKWRTGCEGRISHLKRRYGWDRSLVDGRDRIATWCGYGVLTHNLVKVAGLAAP